MLVLFLAFLPPYGASATIAKTEEELYDRHLALYGDGNSADDIIVEMSDGDVHADGQANGHEQIKAEVARMLCLSVF